MNKMFAVIAFVFSFNAVAGNVDTLTCEAYGHTDNPENFFDMAVHPQQNVFKVDGYTVNYGKEQYSIVDPESVGLEGLAVVYKDSKNNRLLYLYTNDKGEKEVGISKIEDDSDTFFGDKSVYKQCTLTEDKKDASTEQVLRTAGGGVPTSLAVYSF